MSIPPCKKWGCHRFRRTVRLADRCNSQRLYQLRFLRNQRFNFVHLVEIIKENPAGIPLGEFLVEDINAGEMLSRGWCKVSQPDYRCAKLPFYPNADWNGKKILFERPGGYGDLLFLTPTIAEIKHRWPKCEIWIACFQRFHHALLHNPDVDGFIDYPVPIDKWMEFHAHLWLESIIEENPEARQMHAVDLIAKRARMIVSDKRMRYFVTDEEAKKSESEFPRTTNLHRIGIQVMTKDSCRSYSKIGEVSNLLWNASHEVFLFGRPGDMKTNHPERVTNLMEMRKTFRESCAILQTCDVVVGPDSVMVHVAGALDIPCVAIYGPFPWKLRTAYAS